MTSPPTDPLGSLEFSPQKGQYVLRPSALGVAPTTMPDQPCTEGSDASSVHDSGDEGRPSFSDSDSCLGTTTSTVARVWHDDHWDRVVDENPWELYVDIWEWQYSWIVRSERSKTNEQLEQEQKTRNWLEKLEKLTCAQLREDPDHLRPEGMRGVSIPLCDGPGGDEYQIALTTAGGCPLPLVYCPARLGSIMNGDGSWFRLQGRAAEPYSNKTVPPLTFPTIFKPLGCLAIRTKARPDWFGPEPVTETTDYRVVVDLCSDEMPLWIVASRYQLHTRAEGTGVQAHVPCLPIFDGLLSTDDGGYDIACIVPSLRLLHGRILDEVQSPTFEQVCDLVRQTRANVDPVAIMPHADEIKGLFKETVSSPVL